MGIGPDILFLVSGIRKSLLEGRQRCQRTSDDMPIVQRRLVEATPVARGYPAGEWRSQWDRWMRTPMPAGFPYPSWAAGALPVSPLQLFRGRKPANP